MEVNVVVVGCQFFMFQGKVHRKNRENTKSQLLGHNKYPRCLKFIAEKVDEQREWGELFSQTDKQRELQKCRWIEGKQVGGGVYKVLKILFKFLTLSSQAAVEGVFCRTKRTLRLWHLSPYHSFPLKLSRSRTQKVDNRKCLSDEEHHVFLYFRTTSICHNYELKLSNENSSSSFFLTNIVLVSS